MRSDWSKMWRVICSNTARAKRTQIFAQKSIHSLRLETLETARVSSEDEIFTSNAIRNFEFSFRTALFSPFFDLFSKWQVEGKGSKTLAIVFFSTANFPLWQSISARIFESHSLCRPRATNLSAFDCSRQESRISTCQDIIVNLT